MSDYQVMYLCDSLVFLSVMVLFFYRDRGRR